MSTGQQQRMTTSVCPGPISELNPRCDPGSSFWTLLCTDRCSWVIKYGTSSQVWYIIVTRNITRTQALLFSLLGIIWAGYQFSSLSWWTRCSITRIDKGVWLWWCGMWLLSTEKTNAMGRQTCQGLTKEHTNMSGTSTKHRTNDGSKLRLDLIKYSKSMNI